MEDVKWSDEYGFIRDGRVYLRGYLQYPDRQIGEVKHSEEASVEYFRNRYQMAKQKIADLEQLINEAQNKGSYLMKLLHLREYLADYDGLGDYPALFQKLDELEAQLRESIAVNRVRNLEIKHALLQEASTLAESSEWKETAEKLKELKTKWIKTGSVAKEHEDDVEQQFQTTLDTFFQRRKAFFEERERVTKEKVDRYQALIQQANQIKNSTDMAATAQEFRRLQAEWKAVGKVPQKYMSRLWKDFKNANDQFFTRYKGNRKPSDNYVRRPDPVREAQEKLCKEAEELLQASDIVKSAERAKELLMEWRNIKIVPPKRPDRRLSDQFREACDRIFEMNYLIRVIKRRHFFFDKKSLKDQLEIKVSTMTYLIRKDKEELDTYEGNVDGMNMMNKNQTMDRLVSSKLNVQRRKIGVKERLLDDFKRELAALL